VPFAITTLLGAEVKNATGVPPPELVVPPPELFPWYPLAPPQATRAKLQVNSAKALNIFRF
jgi:hypothetical protein